MDTVRVKHIIVIFFVALIIRIAVLLFAPPPLFNSIQTYQPQVCSTHSAALSSDDKTSYTIQNDCCSHLIILAIAGSGLCALIYVLATKMTISPIGITAGALSALLPSQVIMSLTITPFLPWSICITAAVLSGLYFQRQYHLLHGINTGFWIGLAALLMPHILMFPLWYGILYALRYIQNSPRNCLKLFLIPQITALIIYFFARLLFRHTMLYTVEPWSEPIFELFSPITGISIVYGAVMLAMMGGIVISRHLKLFVPLHSLLITSTIATLLTTEHRYGATTIIVTIAPCAALYAAASIVVVTSTVLRRLNVGTYRYPDNNYWRFNKITI